MSSFQQFVYKRPDTLASSNLGRGFSPLSRSPSPLSIAAPQHFSSINQTQSAPVAHFGYSFDRIPLFPQQRTLSSFTSISSSSAIQRRSVDDEPLPDVHMKTQQESDLDERDDEEQALQRVSNSKSELEQHIPSIPSTAPTSASGLPENLKAGAESLSGIAMDDVHVDYNSYKPAQVQALAYTQGRDIYLGPGQERHLAHEVWHVVQQKQGRVRPTLQAKGVAINDDEALETEADVMGARMNTVQRRAIAGSIASQAFQAYETPVQRKRLYFKPKDETKVGADIKMLDTMAGVLDTETEAAHKDVVDKLQKAEAGTYVIDKNDFLGSTDKRITHWIDTLKGKNNKLKAAATGYIIEDIVTAKVDGKAGYTAQHMMPGARPDFLLEDGTKRGVVDVTSTGDKGHILDKKFSISSFDYAVESLYPQINFANINTTSLAVSDATVKAAKAIRKQRAAARFVKILNQVRSTLILIMEGNTDDTIRKSAKVAVKVVAEMIGGSSSSFADEMIKALDKKLAFIRLKTKYDIQGVRKIIDSIQKKYGVANTPPWR